MKLSKLLKLWINKKYQISEKEGLELIDIIAKQSGLLCYCYSVKEMQKQQYHNNIDKSLLSFSFSREKN